MPRFCSIFSQLLQLFPRVEFQKAVTARKAERHARGFTCWGQFVAMLLCQLGRAALVAGDLRRTGQLRGQVGPPGHRGAESRDPRVRERAPPLGAVPGCVSGAAGARSSGRRESSVPLQEQTALAGCDRHRSVRRDVSVGDLPPHQGRGEVALHAGPRRRSADVDADHRRGGGTRSPSRGSNRSRPARSSCSIAGTPISAGSRRWTPPACSS